MEVHSFDQLIDAVLARKAAFLVTFAVVFLLSYGVLAWVDFLPEPVQRTSDTEATTPLPHATSTLPILVTEEPVIVAPVEPIYPTELLIPSLDKRLTILNPTSRSVTDLDEALLRGVVRHPDSATLEQTGTVFILGHSSYLPSVRNANFQAFNSIQNLKFGDEIIAEAPAGTFVYRVEKVYRAKASELVVPIAGDTRRLYLATCNSFGSTDDRYIVEAILVSEDLVIGAPSS